MKRQLLKTARVLGLLVVAPFVLLACDPPPDPTDPRVPKEDSQRLSEEQVTAVTADQGKPGAPVKVSYEMTGTPVVGQVSEIELDFETSISDAPVYVSYAPVDSSAVSLVDAPAGRAALPMQAEGNGRAGHDKIRIIPRRDGRHFVTVLVEVQTDTGPMTNSVSIPVEVAGLGANLQSPGAAAPQQPPVETDASGESVIPMPARER